MLHIQICCLHFWPRWTTVWRPQTISFFWRNFLVWEFWHCRNRVRTFCPISFVLTAQAIKFSLGPVGQLNSPTSEFELLTAKFGSLCSKSIACKSNWYLSILLTGKARPFNCKCSTHLCWENANSSLPLFYFTVTTATPDKKIVKYSANTFTPRFSTTTTTTALNQLVWPSLSFPPLPVFPNPSNFPQFQVK